MARHCIAICLAVVLLRSGDAEEVTKDQIVQITRNPSEASKIELTLWNHSGNKEDGTFVRAKGDGTVTVGNTISYPLRRGESHVEETLRLRLPAEDVIALARLFADER